MDWWVAQSALGQGSMPGLNFSFCPSLCFLSRRHQIATLNKGGPPIGYQTLCTLNTSYWLSDATLVKCMR